MLTATPTLRTRAAHGLAISRRWFRAFRRTRPFWGGLWLLLGGWAVLRLSMLSVQVVVATGLTGLGGWLTGGGMILCGLVAWFAPGQRYVAGIAGLVLAVSSLIVSNLGGLFVGMLLGIIGGAMTCSWGPKKARADRGERVYRVTLMGLERRDRAVSEPAEPVAVRRRPSPGPSR